MAVKARDTVAVTMALLTACAPGQQQSNPAGPHPNAAHRVAQGSAAEIERITLARAPVMGRPGPSYSLILTDSGRAIRIEGENDPPQSREFTASLDTAAFHRLAQLVIDDGFFAWPSEQRMISGERSLAITVWLTRYRFHSVAGMAGAHMALGAALDSLSATLQWTPDPQSPGGPQ